MSRRKPPAEQSRFRNGKVEVQATLREQARTDGKVECLGMLFDSEERRREHFLGLLRERLKDPEFRKTPGFPKGSDDAILRRSDPPYYTACPNPFIAGAVAALASSPSPPGEIAPYTVDLQEGKNDPAYGVHAYPTKVPPGAIETLIRHYLPEGGVVLDPFCGTGMTGVAARRHPHPIVVVQQDLSTCATHIAASLANWVAPSEFEEAARTILQEAEARLGWMYETRASGRTQKVRYFVWSDFYNCQNCGEAIRVWDVEGAASIGGLKEKGTCPACSADTSKQMMNPTLETVEDPVLRQPIQRIRRELVMKAVEEVSRVYDHPVEGVDTEVLARARRHDIAESLPTAPMLFKSGDWGDQWRSSYHLGVTHSHHFYTYRNFAILCDIWSRIHRVEKVSLRHALHLQFTASLSRLTRLNRYMRQHDRHVGPLSGTLFIGPIQAEISPFYFMARKVRDIVRFLEATQPHQRGVAFTSTCSSTRLPLADETVDFVFTDPPFGDNLAYSELNFLVESWLEVYTDQAEEAVISKAQRKGLSEFQALMSAVLAETYRVLRPGRWLVMEFHNSQNSVWAAIQESLMMAGFVIADVRTLDKVKGTTKQLTQSGTVKQDLIITAYRPTKRLTDLASLKAGTEDLVWGFVREHLRQVPVVLATEMSLETVAERQRYMLFDRMVAFHVRFGIRVPMTAGEFYAGLAQRFPERDGMYFLPEQIAEYDRKRRDVKELVQLQVVVTDESSAIQWLRQELTRKPQTFQELHPEFMKEIAAWQKHEKPVELMDMLKGNFVQYDGEGEMPAPIHAYLSSNYHVLRGLPKDDPQLRHKGKDRWYVPDPKKAADLVRIRERELLREFAAITSAKGRVKQLRTEAARIGFKTLWEQGDYKAIVEVASKLPTNVVEEDPHLLMYLDLARSRIE